MLIQVMSAGETSRGEELRLPEENKIVVEIFL